MVRDRIAFTRGKLISGRAEQSVSGGGTNKSVLYPSKTNPGGSFAYSWGWLPDPNFHVSQPYGVGEFYAKGGTAWGGKVNYTWPEHYTCTSQPSVPLGGGRSAAIEAWNLVPTLKFSVPTNLVPWTVSGTFTTNVSHPSLLGTNNGSATCSITLRLDPGGPKLTYRVEAKVFELTIIGVPSLKYALQVSSDLTQWAGVITNTAPFTFTERLNSPTMTRYFRAVYPDSLGLP